MTNVPNAYREADVRGATAVRLVVLLYEQIIRDLTQAAQAIEQNDIESRTKFINHALLVDA
jgi:flagellar biosynthetic protein FliS